MASWLILPADICEQVPFKICSNCSIYENKKDTTSKFMNFVATWNLVVPKKGGHYIVPGHQHL